MSTPRDLGQLPLGVYLASAATTRADDQAAEGQGNLAELEAEVLTTRLTNALKELGAYAEDVAERHSGDTEAAPVELMAAICEAPDASLLYASLARRVDAGAITWQQVWHDPRSYDGGLQLLGEVLRLQVTNLDAE